MSDIARGNGVTGHYPCSMSKRARAGLAKLARHGSVEGTMETRPGGGLVSVISGEDPSLKLPHAIGREKVSCIFTCL